MNEKIVPFIPIILLLMLYACVSSDDSSDPALPTQTGVMVTTASTLTSTPDFVSPAIYSQLNRRIEMAEPVAKYSQLEHIQGATYQVTGVQVVPIDSVSAILRVSARCECAENGPCCNASHTFIVTLIAMEESKEEWIGSVPGSVTVLEVWCFDHNNLTQTISLPWGDVIRFFDGSLDGFWLAARITPSP